jgi:hypothetical protein
MNENERLERRLEHFYAQVPPPPNELRAGRERFLAQAARLREERPLAGARVQAKPPRRWNMKLALTYKILAAILAIIVGTTAAGGGAAYAAADSLPGDALYPLKLTVEDARMAWTSSPVARARLGLTFATARAVEMQQLAEQGKPVPETVPARMVQYMEQAMAQIARSPQGEVPALLEQVMVQAQEQERALEQVQAQGDGESQVALRRALESAQRAYETASAAQGDPSRYQKEYQRRYEGEAGPHGTATPEPQQQQQKQGAGGQQDPGQNQGQGEGGSQNRKQNQEQNSTVTPTVTPQQDQERKRDQDRTATPTTTPQQDQERKRDQDRTGTPTVTPQQEQEQKREQDRIATPAATPQQEQEQKREQNGPTVTPTPQQHQEQNREENGPEATPTPQQQHQEKNEEQNGNTQPTATPEPSQGTGGQQSGGTGKGN